MPLTNPFRSAADRPTLRERAAASRASLAPASPQPAPLPAPGSEEAMAAFHAACHEHTIRTEFANEYPDLKRTPLEWWTADTLSRAMETGEITPAECARLYPRATERELRLAEIGHELKLGALHALAFANEYPVASTHDAEDEADADLLALVPTWKAAVSLYQRRIAEEDVIEAAPNPPERIAVAEEALREAGDALHEIETRIGGLSASTLAGLRFKARVAKRSNDNDLDWPDHLGPGLVQDILTIGEPDAETDAELIRLGHQFEAARGREMAACEACNAASSEARKHMPERPAALRYRASDHALYLHKHYTSPEYLDGREITSDDVEWVSRKRHARDVRRPVRPEDNLPASAQFVVGSEPWPEAQARADEIVAVWNAWHADRDAVYVDHGLPSLEEKADKAGEATAALAERLAAIPARTADGFRIKLRALAFYRGDVLDPKPHDEPDPDHILSHSIWRDVQGDLPEAPPAQEPNLVGLIDLPTASMAELLTIRDIARGIGDGAAAYAWGGRCHRRLNAYGAPEYNAAGRLVTAVSDALTAVESAAEQEAKRRAPTDEYEQNARLFMLAPAIIDNGDPEEIATFARDLLKYARKQEGDTPTDPVLDLIAESLRVEEAAAELEASWQSIPPAERAGREDAMSDRQAKARDAALKTLPTTHEGLKAFADYVGYQSSLTYGSDWRAKIQQEMGGDLLVALCAAVETAGDA